MKRLFLISAWLLSLNTGAQLYISTGKIEYEVRTNNHKMFGDGIWGEMMKDKLPQFSTKYYGLTFDNDQSLYKFERKDEATKIPFDNGDGEEDIWYNEYKTQTCINQKFVFDDTYNLSDSLMKIEWKLSPNETREFAGFMCRKATGVIFDSVYVFAFYTDEITVSGGPMGLHGLPGMIMAATIPRMHTSWIATKLQVNGVNTAIIKAPTKGKKKKGNELLDKVKKATADWGSWGQQKVWDIFL